MADSFVSVGISISETPPSVLVPGPFLPSFPISAAVGTGHYGIPKGTSGRNGRAIVGIVIHALESTIETYIAYLGFPLTFADVRPDEHGSVHYGIEANGAIHRFIPETDTAWGIQGLVEPTWDLLPDYAGVNPNYLFIQIGVERFLSVNPPTLMFRALAELCAYLCVTYEIEVDADHIITHDMLEATFEECSDNLTTNLVATVQSLLTQAGEPASVDTTILAQQIAALQADVLEIQTELGDSLATIETFSSHVTTNATSSTLGHVKASSTLGVAAGVASVTQNVAAYKRSSSSQSVVADIASIVQFPTVISDTFAWGTLGAAQKLTPTLNGVFRLSARVQFAAATWTAGNYVKLEVYKNGGLLEQIAYKTIESNLSSKIVELQGECIISRAILTDYYQVVVKTDDANGAKSIVDAFCSIERIGA